MNICDKNQIQHSAQVRGLFLRLIFCFVFGERGKKVCSNWFSVPYMLAGSGLNE